MKKVIKTVLALTVGLFLGLAAVMLFQMYKPVWDASKPIDGLSEYTMNVTDELVDRDAKIIGLGEATHGNKEFQELKLEVLKTLVRDNGVSAFCLEMDYGEGLLINDYIRGRSDMTCEELFSHISFELYHTEAIRELIEWMKSYNTDSRDGYLEFYGFDIQNPETDVYAIREFSKQNNIPVESTAMDAFLANEFTFGEDGTDELLEELENCREALSSVNYQELYNIGRILKCIDNVSLAKGLADAYAGNDSVAYGMYRDKAMADNIAEISENVGYPIMISGHNGHVGYAGSYVKTMGSYLRDSFGEEYFVIGTDYFKTTASIKSSDGRKNHISYSADPLAYQAKDLGTYYLRFDDIRDNERLNSIITGKMSTGSLGEGFSFLNNLLPASVRVYAPVTDLYDGMIFVYKASPFTLLDY